MKGGRVCLRRVEKKDCDEFLRLIRKSSKIPSRSGFSAERETPFSFLRSGRGGEASAAHFLHAGWEMKPF